MTENNLHTIAIDAMGSERGVSVCIQGALDYLEYASTPVNIVLVGDEASLKDSMAEFQIKSEFQPYISLSHADESIRMGDRASDGIRKKNSSVAAAVRLQHTGEADATISPGHTGAFMAASLFTLGRLKNVSRPAIATVFPSENTFTLVLDVGANAMCKAQNLYEFAIMGSVYSHSVMKCPEPRVAILSIGEERTKGNDLTLATYDLLSKSPLNFVGNIEGRDILRGKAEVVICDGFVGNIILKFAESIKGFVFNKFRHQISSNAFSRIGAILMGPFLRRLHRTFDYSEVGGAPLLGVKGNCIVAHGRSTPRAILKAIEQAVKMIDSNVNEQINHALMNGARIPVEQS